MISVIAISSSVCGAGRGPEACLRNKEAAGMRRLRWVMTFRAAYFSDVKYQPLVSRFVVMANE
jgi:hypothetical protein